MNREKIKEIFKKNLKWIVLFVCLVGFLALAEDVYNHDLMRGDIIGYNFVSKYLISDSMTPIMKGITWVGSAPVLISIALILFVLIKNKKTGLAIFLNLFVVSLLNQILKFILQRPRPTEYRIINESGYSFPSGHSMISMAFYGFLIYLIYKNIKNKYLKWILIVLLSLLILGIGVSRIYLGVHYTSDVLAGFLISISYLVIYIKLYSEKIIGKEYCK